MQLAYTGHARDMLAERRIPEEWVVRTVKSPLRAEQHDDGTMHYTGKIPTQGDRILRVVVNPAVDPPLVVTVFFDRRLRRIE
jgi:hypothetical protein